jgi:molybdopterin-guanine dinucleotide biosynthesis protein A
MREGKIMNSEFSAVLLAGGKSARMGRDKAAVKFEGKALWQRQIETLRATSAGELFISGRADAEYSAAGLPIVADDSAGRGPLGGIVTALRHAQFDYLLVLAIDLPAITGEFLRSLVKSAIDAGCGLVPANEQWFEGLAAVYTRACLPLAEARLHSADRSMQSFIRAGVSRGLMLTHHISASERALFRNVNTPAALGTALDATGQPSTGAFPTE